MLEIPDAASFRIEQHARFGAAAAFRFTNSLHRALVLALKEERITAERDLTLEMVPVKPLPARLVRGLPDGNRRYANLGLSRPADSDLDMNKPSVVLVRRSRPVWNPTPVRT